jgi:spore maturation protein CgeB
VSAQPSAWFVVVPPEGAAREAGLETARAFTALLGIDSCKVFDSRKYLDFFIGQLKRPEETLVIDLFNHALAVQCLDFGAGNCLVCALSPVTLFTLNLLRSHGVKTTHWFYEDFRVARYWKTVIEGYDTFFAIQKGPLPDACRHAGCAYSFLPTAAGSACNASDPARAPADRPRDVAFIGIPSPYRVETLEHLAALGLSLCVAGLGWDRYDGPLRGSIVNNAWTDAKQAGDLLRTSKIGINLSVQQPGSDRPNTHVSPRVYDVLASGCVLVTEDVPLAHDALKNLHFHTFSDKQEAGRCIAGILAGMDKEEPFLESNRAVVCRDHTYEKRVREIIQLTGETR